MLKRSTTLAFLADVLFAMLPGDDRPDVNKCKGIILDIEPSLKTNKVLAIKELREWFHGDTKITISPNMGTVLKEVLQKKGYLYYYGDDFIRITENTARLGLKEAKDFVDLMEAVLEKTEPKSF